MNEFEIMLADVVDVDIDFDRESRWESKHPQLPEQMEFNDEIDG